ncbi:MAG: hypothetical protein IJK64_08385 [Clostridia bacterium]|nr:hypothetical protein [Clostridia bacterium]
MEMQGATSRRSDTAVRRGQFFFMIIQSAAVREVFLNKNYSDCILKNPEYNSIIENEDLNISYLLRDFYTGGIENEKNGIDLQTSACAGAGGGDRIRHLCGGIARLCSARGGCQRQGGGYYVRRSDLRCAGGDLSLSGRIVICAGNIHAVSVLCQ